METSQKTLRQYAEALSGISYLDWFRLRTGMDKVFDKKRREAEVELRLSSAEDITEAIQTQFGCRLD